MSMILAYEYSKVFLVINRNLDKNQFLRLTGAESGFSKEMFTKIYESIFSELIDAETEFEEYYSFEYKDLETYLFKKYNLNAKDVEDLTSLLKSNSDYKLYRTHVYSYGDYQIPQFITSETMYDKIVQILLLK